MLNALEDETKEPFEPERRLYKGDLTTVEKLAGQGLAGYLPIQPVKRNLRFFQLPPSFVLTKLQPTQYGGYYMHYYCPKTKVRTYRDVPRDLELNVLTGIRGKELSHEWEDVRVSKLGTIGRRLVCTMGTDPEIFAVNDNGEIVPAWTYLPDKKNPQTFRLNNKAGTAYWDGFQAEFTTQNGGETCLSWILDNVQGGLKTIMQAAKKVNAKLTIESVLPVNPDILQIETNEHVQFGCAPSYNAYGLKGNIEDGRMVPYRFAGGHLHFGTSNTDHKRIEKLVKALDMVLGVASVSLLGELDNPIRRRFYGLPGEYRLPSHGFEYRTLSNAWMCHPLAMNMVFDLARSVCGLADEDFLEPWQSSEEETLGIIINNDITRAREVLNRNKEMFRQICKVITGPYYTTDEQLDMAFKVWSNGIDSAVKDPKDLVENWTLDRLWITHSEGRGKNWGKAYDHLVKGEKL